MQHQIGWCDDFILLVFQKWKVLDLLQLQMLAIFVSPLVHFDNRALYQELSIVAMGLYNF